MMRRLRGGEPQPPVGGAISGTARVDRRTKRLIPRLNPGDIAVIDHEDIDRVAAEGLIQRQTAAVVNASRSSTGRYPNLGPVLLCSAGIPLIDDAGTDVMNLPEGASVVIDDGQLYVRGLGGISQVGSGELMTLESVQRSLDAAKRGIASQIERFAANTIEYIRDERDVLIEAARLPDVKTDFHGRHVLIVVRGYDYKEDLAILRSYIREVRPILVGVDGGADALLEASLKPDMIIGDMDSVTTEALDVGAELVVHAFPDGRAPGLERIRAAGLRSVIFEATGTSEDIAMLLAYERGAELIVAVGTHANLIEFLDKGRKGMASTFLTRLRVGTILVDAKGVSRLYRSRVKTGDVLMLVGSALLVLMLAVSLSEPLRLYLQLLWVQLQTTLFDVRQALF
jgi:uncharacterized membrane-anchored protein